jgi:hypothetical protein
LTVNARKNKHYACKKHSCHCHPEKLEIPHHGKDTGFSFSSLKYKKRLFLLIMM